MRGKAGGKQMIEKCRMIEFPQKGDDRGHLVIVEGNQDIPFEIKRVFYINVAGTSKVKVDDGTEQKIFSLDRPHTGIFLPRMVWKDMYDFSEDSVLLVLASEHYDETEYIRSYPEYLEIMKGEDLC